MGRGEGESSPTKATLRFYGPAFKTNFLDLLLTFNFIMLYNINLHGFANLHGFGFRFVQIAKWKPLAVI